MSVVQGGEGHWNPQTTARQSEGQVTTGFATDILIQGGGSGGGSLVKLSL